MTSSPRLAEAAFGFHAGFIGRILPDPDKKTPCGRVFITGKPVAIADLAVEAGFVQPAHYAEHGIVSALIVPIPTRKMNYGVLTVESTLRRTFDIVDANFLIGFGNVLGRAINMEARDNALLSANEQLQAMIADRAQYVAAHERIWPARIGFLKPAIF